MRRCRSLSEPFDHGLSCQLVAYIATGMVFMLLPGTFLGVWNLLTISARRTPSAVGSAWIQAHGHAQIFGWLGTFILGIGFYAIPRLRLTRYSAAAGWITFGIWTAGVTLRWAVGVSAWHWRILFPLAAVLELMAALLFFASVFLRRIRNTDSVSLNSIVMIEAAAIGMLVVLTVNLVQSIVVGRDGSGPLFPAAFNQRFLALATWGFVVPFIWGFATRWIPPLLGLPKAYKPLFLPLVIVLFAGAALGTPVVIAAASIAFPIALRIFERSERQPKLRGVHQSVGVFLRSAFLWMIVAAILGSIASVSGAPNGLIGASRHALTVGFIVVTVFCIAPRVLPAFFGVRRLFSTRLMFASLLLVSAGCLLRVSSQVLAYGNFAASAWEWLPVSAILEMTAVAIFAFNMAMSLTTGTPADTVAEAQRQQAGISAAV